MERLDQDLYWCAVDDGCDVTGYTGWRVLTRRHGSRGSAETPPNVVCKRRDVVEQYRAARGRPKVPVVALGGKLYISLLFIHHLMVFMYEYVETEISERVSGRRCLLRPTDSDSKAQSYSHLTDIC